MREDHRVEPLLEIRELSVGFRTRQGGVAAVRGVSLEVHRGEVVALVGESGSGKTVTALSVLDLLPSPPAFRAGGRIVVEGTDLAELTPRQRRELGGRRVGMVFQDPAASLNPTFTIGFLLREALGRAEAAERVRPGTAEAELLARVGLEAHLVRARPYELSGGMQQRILLAMALAARPRLLLADEPTTALDVHSQADIVALIERECKQRGLGVLFVTHDLALASGLADRLVVLHGGIVVETGPTGRLVERAHHPCTQALLDAILDPMAPRARDWSRPPPEPLPPLPGRGCPGRLACGHAEPRCEDRRPPLVEVAPGHRVACHDPSNRKGRTGD